MDAQAGTNSKNNNNNFMRKSRQYFLSRFLDTGLPLFNIYSKFKKPSTEEVQTGSERKLWNEILILEEIFLIPSTMDPGVKTQSSLLYRIKIPETF